MAMELPGFETPDAPKAAVNLFSELGQRVDLVIQDNVPMDRPLPWFEILIQKAIGNQVENLATADNTQIITREGTLPGTKSYWLLIMPDELYILRGTYRVRARVNGKDVFRTSLTIGHQP